MPNMRAKMRINKVDKPYEGAERIQLSAVTRKDPFGPNGESEDNTYARYTPSGSIDLTITNPSLIGKFKDGETFYVDFTPAE